MKRVVFGASGGIGKAFCRLSEMLDYQTSAQRSSTIDLTNVNSPSQVSNIVSSGDDIIMLAALTPEKGDASRTTRDNILMLEHLLKGIKGISYRHLVYISTDAVYSLDSDIIDEMSPTIPDRLYGYAHLVREHMLREQVKAEKLTIFRPCAVYGHDDTHNAYGVMKFIRQANKNHKIDIFGGGEEMRDHIYCEDLVQLINKALIDQVSGIYNATSGHSFSFMEIASYIATLFPHTININFVPRVMPIKHRHMNIVKLWSEFPEHRPRRVMEGINKLFQGTHL